MWPDMPIIKLTIASTLMPWLEVLSWEPEMLGDGVVLIVACVGKRYFQEVYVSLMVNSR